MRMSLARCGTPYVPPSPEIGYIDTYTGTNTATLGTHMSGDVLIAVASRNNSSTAPTIPGGQSWSAALATNSTNSLGCVIVGKIATGASEGVGTFTNATSVSIIHYRPASGITPSFGATNTSVSTNIVNQSIPSLSLSVTDGTSIVFGFYLHRSADISGLSTPPSGMDMCGINQDATDTQACYMSSAPVASWSSAAVNFTGTSGVCRTYALELVLSSGNDTTPNQFTFTDQTNVALSTVIESNTIQVTGINASTAISITGGEYRINAGGWTSASGNVVNNDTVQVRHTSSGSNSTVTNTALTVGGVSDTFTTTTVAASGGWQLAAGHYEASKFALEIVEPRAGLTTTNRYYKTYPSIEYRVPVVVAGGSWPYKYELTTAPSGMTIGETHGSANYGIIVWSNPVTSGSPHTVAIRVTDQECTIVTVSYTLTVTTTGFIFVDAINGGMSVDRGGSATGAIGSPFQTIQDWYYGDGDWYGGSSVKWNGTYEGYFVIYRTGTYHFNAAPLEGGVRVTCPGNRKPLVHMAYPGETSTLNADGTASLLFDGTSGAPFISGFTTTGQTTGNKLFEFSSGATPVFFNNIIGRPTSAPSGENASFIFSIDNTTYSGFVAIIGNTYNGSNGNRDLYLAYRNYNVVFENNTISNNDGLGCDLKIGFQYCSIRNNTGLTGNTGQLAIVDTYSTAADVEICWNNYKSTGYGVFLGVETGAVSNIEDYRNTWQVPYNNSINTGSGDWNPTRNVIVHNGSYTEGYRVESGGVTITRTQQLAATSGLIDSSTGLLTGTDRANYLG